MVCGGGGGSEYVMLLYVLLGPQPEAARSYWSTGREDQLLPPSQMRALALGDPPPSPTPIQLSPRREGHWIVPALKSLRPARHINNRYIKNILRFKSRRYLYRETGS
jgi:hypothetical protein